MSNISFITTRKHLHSYNFPSLFHKINQKRFDGKMNITINERLDCLEVKYMYWDRHWDSLEFYKRSPRKLSVGHPHSQWMEYVGCVFRNELGKMTGGLLSDDGLEEHWKPSPKKYPKYKVWVEKMHSSIKPIKPLLFKEIVETELTFAPKGMEKY